MPKLAGVNHLDAVRALEKAGFQIARQSKHIVMSDGVRIVTIPRRNPVNAFSHGGIHWPDLDEDISIRSLLLGRRDGSSRAFLKFWLTNKKKGRLVFLEDWINEKKKKGLY